MRYDQLTRGQKEQAQRILQQLRNDGVETSVSQVAKHLDDASEWDRKVITTATLLDRTGWDRSAPVETLHRAELPAGVMRHLRSVLSADGSADSKEALELLPEV